jgi:DNA-binding NtrC family response regulator
MLYATRVTTGRPRIFHVSSREMIQKLRDEILRLHGFEVQSTLSLHQALEDVPNGKYDLVLIDVEGESKVSQAEQLCDALKKLVPDQQVAYVCNYRVAIDSDCPDEVIRAEFNPAGFVHSLQQLISNR